MKKLTVKLLGVFNEVVLLPVMRWAAEDMIPKRSTVNDSTEYVTADESINVLVLSAALYRHNRQSVDDPHNCQALLNACLEAVRSGDVGKTACNMLMGLLAEGYDANEALYRVISNSIRIGMYVQQGIDSPGPSGAPAENL